MSRSGNVWDKRRDGGLLLVLTPSAFDVVEHISFTFCGLRLLQSATQELEGSVTSDDLRKSFKRNKIAIRKKALARAPF